MIKDVLFKGKVLTVILNTDQQKNINVDSTISKVVHTDRHIAVLFKAYDLYGTEHYNRNIICLNENGEIIWRIAKTDSLSEIREKKLPPYSNLVLKKCGYLRVGDSLGFMADVDINTGQFVSKWKFFK